MKNKVFFICFAGVLMLFSLSGWTQAQILNLFESTEHTCGDENVCGQQGSAVGYKFSENSISFGYGFGMFNYGITNKIMDGHYEFYQIAYKHERPFYKGFYLVIDPYLSYIRNPHEGFDISLGFSSRYYLNSEKKNSFFVDLGVGGVYSTLQYGEQSNHAFFLIQGGIGYRWDRFFIENILRHYSNGYTASKNRAIHSNIISIGLFF